MFFYLFLVNSSFYLDLSETLLDIETVNLD